MSILFSPTINSISAQLGTDTHQVFSNTSGGTFMLASVHMHDWVSIKSSEHIGYVELESHTGLSEMFS